MLKIHILIIMLHTVRFELHVKLGIYSAINSNNPNRKALSFSPLMLYTRVGTLIVATIYLQLIQNTSRYMFRSFTVLHCSHQHCVQPVASDVEVVGYL